MATALLFVDVQRNMLEGELPVPAADLIRSALELLLDRARAEGAVVVHVQNDGGKDFPDEPFTKGWELVFPPLADELVVRKDIPDTFAANPTLAATLTERGVDRVVVAGMQSDYCIAATSEAARRAGLDVVLASGAHATYDEGESAANISARIEVQLTWKGVLVVPASDVRFG